MQTPTHLIVDVGDCIRDLNKAVSNPELPTVDAEALLDAVVDALLHDATADSELMQFFDPYCVNTELYSENLQQWDSAEESEILAFSTLSSTVVRIGQDLRSIFKNYKLFEQGFLNYEYGGKLNERTIVLRRRRS